MQPEQRPGYPIGILGPQITADHVGVDHRFFDNACCGASIDKSANQHMGMMFEYGKQESCNQEASTQHANLKVLYPQYIQHLKGIRLALTLRRPWYHQHPNEMTICHGAPRTILCQFWHGLV